jgi:hypothetical protein
MKTSRDVCCEGRLRHLCAFFSWKLCSLEPHHLNYHRRIVLTVLAHLYWTFS